MANPPSGSHSRPYMLTPEYRQKMSDVKRGCQLTPEQRAKQAAALRGRKFSQEHRAKLSEANKGRVYTPETRRKMSESQKKKHKHLSKEHHAALLKANLGKPKTIEWRLERSLAMSGPGNHEWRGGMSFEPYCPKFNEDLKRRIRAFFENQCILCGKHRSEEIKALSCHHVEYNKSACCDGKPVHFAALCVSCHSKTNHSRPMWEAILHRIIDEIYEGRSYLTKEEYFNYLKNGGV